jgi:hypothetical protein
MQRAAQRLHAVAGFPVGGLAQGFERGDHHFRLQNAHDEVGNGGGSFLAAKKREIGKQGDGQGAANFREGVAVEEEKGGAPMTGFEELKGFQQRQVGTAFLFPLCLSRCVSFRVNASLRAASFAEVRRGSG